MGKNNTKAEKMRRNEEYALKFKKRKKSKSKPAWTGTSPSTGAPRSASAAPRSGFPAVCSACSTATTLPFEPTTGKPVFCRPCFDATRNLA